MDKERAKFVLQSFRPDGADVGDDDFAEALKLATVDRELGEWLVKERAFDAEFAECLARVDLPQGLRESVLLAMVQSGSGYPKVELEDDRAMVTGMANVKVPVELRARILESMERTKIVEMPTKSWMRFGMPVAAAAGMVMAFVFLMGQPKGGNLADASKDRITVDAVQASFVGMYQTPGFSLEKKGTDQHELVSYLKGKKLPCGGMRFPKGLEGMKGLGCREIMVGDKKGSLICFGEQDGIVHLIIFRRGDVDGELPTEDEPHITQSGEWAQACWANEKYAYTLISKNKGTELRELF
ncbi:MAG: hypothetical protein V4727_11925 [Verrucomicrobiota bacterium]